MRLIRELLDAQVVDGNHHALGKVDGVVVELRTRGRPRVSALQIGAPVLARRLHAPIRPIVQWFAQRWQAETMTIPWSRVHEIGVDLEVHLEGETPASRKWERWLVEHVIARIPGS